MAADTRTKTRRRVIILSLVATKIAVLVIIRRRQLAKHRDEFHARYG